MKDFRMKRRDFNKAMALVPLAPLGLFLPIRDFNSCNPCKEQLQESSAEDIMHSSIAYILVLNLERKIKYSNYALISNSFQIWEDVVMLRHKRFGWYCWCDIATPHKTIEQVVSAADVCIKTMEECGYKGKNLSYHSDKVFEYTLAQWAALCKRKNSIELGLGERLV